MRTPQLRAMFAKLQYGGRTMRAATQLRGLNRRVRAMRGLAGSVPGGRLPSRFTAATLGSFGSERLAALVPQRAQAVAELVRLKRLLGR